MRGRGRPVSLGQDIWRRFKRHRLHWLEEPVFPPEDLDSLRAVGEGSGTPLAAGENLCFATQFSALLSARAVSYIQPSVTKVGGISEERRIEFTKVVKKMAEDGRIAIRHVRRDAIEHLKKETKDGLITEDELKHAEKEVQRLTDQYIAKIDEHLAHKEKEIMTV